jgi:hypothetical protein
MLQIITKAPFYVWPLFAILLATGLKARKTSIMPLAPLVILPCAFLVWSLYSFFGTYGLQPLTILFWMLCFGTGIFIGFLHMQKLNIKCEKEKRRLEMPGSWIPLLLSMSIFCSKFMIGMLSSVFPHLNGSFLLLGLELFATAVLGIFAGRGIACLKVWLK